MSKGTVNSLTIKQLSHKKSLRGSIRQKVRSTQLTIEQLSCTRKNDDLIKGKDK
jgi:hypothetical protein